MISCLIGSLRRFDSVSCEVIACLVIIMCVIITHVVIITSQYNHNTSDYDDHISDDF